MITKIFSYYNKEDIYVLTTPCNYVTFPIDKGIFEIIFQLKSTLKKLGGAGLAAPQLGYKHKIILCSFSRQAVDMEIMINPEYKPVSDLTNTSWEGCYSFPLTAMLIKRWNYIKVSYKTETGQNIVRELQGEHARHC